MGVQLLRRDRQTVELTEAGQKFLSTARHVLGTLEAGVQALKEPTDALKTLRVAFPEYAQIEVLAVEGLGPGLSLARALSEAERLFGALPELKNKG